MPKRGVSMGLVCVCLVLTAGSGARPASAQERFAALPPPGGPIDAHRPARSLLRLRTPDAANLVRRSEKALLEGNISAARLLLDRLHRAGDADATLLLAKTYDPKTLVRWGVKGDRGDPRRAQELYNQARRLGAVTSQDMDVMGFDPSAPQMSFAPQAAPAPQVAAVQPPAPPPRPPAATDVAMILRRAERDILLGNLSAARLLLERARLADSPQATLLLAKTYDPYVLARWGVRGMRSDSARAVLLYEQALALGAAEARIRLDALR